MRIRGVLALAAVLGLAAAPEAVAAPQFPDVSNYPEVDEGTYAGPKTYGYTHVQFATPDGVRCRLSRFSRSGIRLEVWCWGALPGLPNDINAAYVQRFYPHSATDGGASLRHADLSSFELVGAKLPGMQPQTVDPSSYHLLPAKHKFLIHHYGMIVTCAVDDARMTACEIEDQIPGELWRGGFVLSPQGSGTF